MGCCRQPRGTIVHGSPGVQLSLCVRTEPVPRFLSVKIVQGLSARWVSPDSGELSTSSFSRPNLPGYFLGSERPAIISSENSNVTFLPFAWDPISLETRAPTEVIPWIEELGRRGAHRRTEVLCFVCLSSRRGCFVVQPHHVWTSPVRSDTPSSPMRDRDGIKIPINYLAKQHLRRSFCSPVKPRLIAGLNSSSPASN